MSAEPTLCFIDTNVWLYAFIQAQNHDKTATAKTIIESSRIVLSSQVVNEVCVNLINKAHFDEVSIRNLVESFYNRYHVALVTQPTLLRASQLRYRHSFSYWDSLIVAAALAEGTTILYSEDMHSGLTVDNSLQIIN